MDPAQLAATGAATFIQAMASDAWTAIRAGIAGLLGRHDARATEDSLRELELARTRLVSRSDHPAAAEERLLRARLEIVMYEDPSAIDELKGLLAALGNDGGAVASQRIVAGRDAYVAGRDQHVDARAHDRE